MYGKHSGIELGKTIIQIPFTKALTFLSRVFGNQRWSFLHVQTDVTEMSIIATC